MGTGALRTIHSRVVWMSLPVERSITVSAPQRVAHVIFSTSSATDDVTAELPMLALILTRKLRPIAIGSDSGWLTFDVIASEDPRPAQWRQAFGRRRARAAGVVQPDGVVAAGERHLGERHAHSCTRPVDVDLGAG